MRATRRLVHGDATAQLLVIGAGLSGSLVVLALDAAGVHAPVELVDSGEHPTLGRTWACWEHRPPSCAAARSFGRLRVVGPTHEHVLAMAEHRYVVIDGDALEAETDAALARIGGRRRTATVQSVGFTDGRARVATATSTVEADLVLDSVGLLEPSPAQARAWLHFTGWRVSCDTAAFDAAVGTLMDFRVPQRGRARFVYVLPDSPRSALVELATYSPVPDPPEDDDDLTAYLDRATGSSHWSVTAREQGSLPLAPRHRRTGRSPGPYLAVGTAGGLVKASTGYGARLMAADAAAIAEDLMAGRHPRGTPRRRRHAWMDDVFLELAITDPDRLVGGLESLFARNPIDRIARFLDEESTLAEELRIMWSLPASPFLRAAWRAGTRPRD